ncbi:MAG: hypothetical protein AAFO63_05740 [Pseudomonadota bacterium]
MTLDTSIAKGGLEIPSLAWGMLIRSWPWAFLFVALHTLFATVSATIFQQAALSGFVFPVLSLAVYCVWLLQLYRAAGLGRAATSVMPDVLRLFWAHILVAFLFAMGVIILMLSMFLAMPVMLIAAGISTDSYPESTDAFLAIMQETGVIWLAGGLLSALCMGLAYFMFRLCLFAAATVDQGHVRVLQTWPWTRGHALFLFIYIGGMVVLPLVLGEVIYRSAFGWALVSDGQNGGAPSLRSVDVFLRSGVQALELVVPTVFAAAISVFGYRAWTPTPDSDPP